MSTNPKDTGQGNQTITQMMNHYSTDRLISQPCSDGKFRNIFQILLQRQQAGVKPRRYPFVAKYCELSILSQGL